MKVRCIRLDPDGGDVVAVLDSTDISRSGLGAMSDRPYYPGQRVLIYMPLNETAGKRNIYAKVIRCRQEEEGYNVGLEFDAASMSLWQVNSPAYAAA